MKKITAASICGGYESENKEVELCSDILSYIKDFKRGEFKQFENNNIEILLSHNADKLEHKISVCSVSCLCSYVKIDDNETVQVLRSVYDWIRSYLGKDTGSFTVRFK